MRVLCRSLNMSCRDLLELRSPQPRAPTQSVLLPLLLPLEPFVTLSENRHWPAKGWWELSSAFSSLPSHADPAPPDKPVSRPPPLRGTPAQSGGWAQDLWGLPRNEGSVRKTGGGSRPWFLLAEAAVARAQPMRGDRWGSLRSQAASPPGLALVPHTPRAFMAFYALSLTLC